MIAVYVFRSQIFQQSASLTNQHQQSTLSYKIMLGGGHMTSQSFDPLSQDCDLNLAGTGVSIINPEVLNDFGFVCFIQFHTPEILYDIFLFIAN
jgi:hypothetical protein